MGGRTTRGWLFRRRLAAEDRVLKALAWGIAHEQRWLHGLSLSRLTRLRGARLYPALRRLKEDGLVDARWDDESRPRRRVYRLVLPEEAPDGQ